MVNFWSKPKKISRKDMSWSQAKARNPKLLPFSDADRDGVSNWLDCKPCDKRRQDKAETQKKLKKLKEDITDIQIDFRDYPEELDEALSDVTSRIEDED